ncbi:unnamed protein product, partial [Adineta steineri]
AIQRPASIGRLDHLIKKRSADGCAADCLTTADNNYNYAALLELQKYNTGLKAVLEKYFADVGACNSTATTTTTTTVASTTTVPSTTTGPSTTAAAPSCVADNQP